MIKNNIGTEHIDFKPVEILTSSDVESNISKAKYESMNQEALNPWGSVVHG